jgi:DNA-binding response OmpR family regulator
VEDEEELLFGLQDRLESEGYTVLAARDGEEALAVASREPVDCIVLDVGLPKKNGFAVCEELRRRGDRTAILMLTARGEITDRVHGLRIGADDYLVKPFATMELVARIDALIRRTAPRPAPRAVEHGAPPPAVLRRPPGRRALARRAAGERLGHGHDPEHAHGRRTRGHAAAEAGGEPRASGHDRDSTPRRV